MNGIRWHSQIYTMWKQKGWCIVDIYGIRSLTFLFSIDWWTNWLMEPRLERPINWLFYNISNCCHCGTIWNCVYILVFLFECRIKAWWQLNADMWGHAGIDSQSLIYFLLDVEKYCVRWKERNLLFVNNINIGCIFRKKISSHSAFTKATFSWWSSIVLN